jgi:preprotein translocase subunit YajC
MSRRHFEEAVLLRAMLIGFASLLWPGVCHAEGASAGSQGGLLGMLMPLALFIVIFYFLIIRPQKKKQKQHENMLASIRRGDQIVTAGGFFGVVKDVKDDSFIVEIADGVKVRLLKSSVSYKRSTEESDVAKTSKKEEETAPQEETASEIGSEQ